MEHLFKKATVATYLFIYSFIYLCIYSFIDLFIYLLLFSCRYRQDIADVTRRRWNNGLKRSWKMLMDVKDVHVKNQKRTNRGFIIIK